MSKSNLIEYLSGGNHELFHSNFLAYIAQEYPDFFKEILSVNKEIKETLDKFDPADCEVLREHLHLDFAIRKAECNKNDDRYILVLENKMKSIPDMDQLESYVNKADADCRILLTMIEAPEENLGKNWIQISYSQLAKRMKKALKNHYDCFFNFLVKPYIEYIETLSEEVDKIKQDFNNQYEKKSLSDFLNSDYKADDSLPKWQSLFLKKVRFQLIADKIKSDFGKDIGCSAGIVRGYLPFIEVNPYDKKHSKKEVNKFWLQIYSDHLEHGFFLYYHTIGEKRDFTKKPTQKDRIQFLRNIWQSALKNDKNLKHLAETINDHKFYGTPFPILEEEIETADFRGYIYKDGVMIYLRSPIPDNSMENPNINIKEFIKGIKKQIELVRTNDKNININNQNNNEIKQ